MKEEAIMRFFLRNILSSLIVLICLVGLSTSYAQLTEDQLKMAEDVRKRLATLPEYGAFDWLTFGVQGHNVILRGYASRPSLKQSAQRAAERAKGVESVENQIEVLPTSNADDEIRTQVYASIYTHPMLQRYAPGGGVTMSGIGRAYDNLSRWGLDGATFYKGSHAVHIIVQNQRVTLVGMLRNDSERQVANVMANQVSGVFEVTNMIEVPEK